MQHCPVGALQSILIKQVSGYDQVQGPCFVFWFKLMFDFGRNGESLCCKCELKLQWGSNYLNHLNAGLLSDIWMLNKLHDEFYRLNSVHISSLDAIFLM